MIFARGSSPLVFNVSCWFCGCGAHRFHATLMHLLLYLNIISSSGHPMNYHRHILNFNRLACVRCEHPPYRAIQMQPQASGAIRFQPYVMAVLSSKILRAISNDENEGLVEPHSRIAKQKQNKRNIRFRIFSAGTLKSHASPFRPSFISMALDIFSARAVQRSLKGAEYPAAIRSTLNFDYVISIWM